MAKSFAFIESEDLFQSAYLEAKEAQKEWGQLSVKERVDILLKVKDYLVDNADNIAEIISSETGKVKMDALSAEVIPATVAVKYYCKNAPKFLKSKRIKKGSLLFANKRALLRREPLGLVGVISPWNYPFTIPFSDIFVALLSGNGVIFKPAPQSVRTGIEIAKALVSAGVPKELIPVIKLSGEYTANEMMERRINKIFFTGSVRTGKILAKAAGEKLIPISLELGGKDPMIICEDANIHRAVNGAIWAGFANAGQSCAGIERIYVHENIYDKFSVELKDKIEKLRVGNDNGLPADIGGITTEEQFSVIESHISDALAKGAKIFARSEIIHSDEERAYYPPTVLIETDKSMDVVTEETFGPVVTLEKFSCEDEAVMKANDSKFGLTASVWTNNIRKGERIAERLEAGAVTLNDHLMTHGLPETPWGGVKDSGIGRSHSVFSFHEMTEPKVIVNDSLSMLNKNIWWHPYEKGTYNGLLGVMQLLYGKKLIKRIKGIKPALSLLGRIREK